MKKSLFLILLVILATVSLELNVSAKSGNRPKKASSVITLKALEDLYYISQDLEENTLIYAKPEKGCFCSCRDTQWSCTDVSCDVQMKKCENPPPEQAESAPQSRLSFGW